MLLDIIIPILIIVGLWLMSRVPTSLNGNRLSMLAMLFAILAALWGLDLVSLLVLILFLFVGGVIGYVMSRRVQMIQMPQMVGLLNGLGGGASMLVGVVTLMGIMPPAELAGRLTNYLFFAGSYTSVLTPFESCTAVLAILVGTITLTGSLVAAGKLHRVLPQKPIHLKRHSFYLTALLVLCLALLTWGTWFFTPTNTAWIVVLSILTSGLFGVLFTIRVGGADMPITISLLNSLSGVAGSIVGMAIGNVMLVAIGGVVGASGLLLTQVMCRAMNRHFKDILLGKTSAPTALSTPLETSNLPSDDEPIEMPSAEGIPPMSASKKSLKEILSSARSVIIVPGYGMALAQAQHEVKRLEEELKKNGATVRYAIHPVAGRMPGHMNVLLAEANVDYDMLREMDEINEDFRDIDLVIVVGANDVLNPAARDAEGTPIYGMPVLNVDQAQNIIICNYDLNPGYAGVPNPLYERKNGVALLLGDAKETVNSLIAQVHSSGETPSTENADSGSLLDAKSVIIVPGYGMALAQAQFLVKQLEEALTENGATVRYAIHPVAGRMPGHMNVLLAEANVDYDMLKEMDEINEDFRDTDLVIVVGANDVLNPAARDAEGTPIYGMPVLNVDQARNIIICNYDLKPGYAGVPNPLYEDKRVVLMLGDAKETLSKLINDIHS